MHRPIDRLVKLAAKNICDGVREEPRLYFDRIPLDFAVAGSNEINGDPQSFVNGEPWPVRLTKIVFSLGLSFDPATVAYLNPPVPLAVLQSVAARIRRSDEYYMNANRIPVPNWLNTVTNPPTNFGNGGTSWTFDRPVILSVRDYMEVEVQALADQAVFLIDGEPTPSTFTATIGVSYSGVGLISGQPYFFGATQEVTNSKPIKMAANRLQNVSGEPIALTDCSTQISVLNTDPALPIAAIVASDSRFFAVQMRQVQNGTRSKWLQGPTVPTPLGRANASLLGLTSGSAIVHTFPGDGIQLEPGEGLRIEAEVLATTTALALPNDNLDVLVGMSGYLVVT
jgi:hypothetical protein